MLLRPRNIEGTLVDPDTLRLTFSLGLFTCGL